MKKSIVALSVALILAISGPAAAAGINFSGSMDTNIEVNRTVEVDENEEKQVTVTVTPESNLELDLELTGGEDNVRAGVEFGYDDEHATLMPSGISTGDLVLKSVFIETDGAYWHGGPEATTRFGSLDMEYSPYAAIADRSGVSVSNLEIGMLGLQGFYGLPQEEGTEGMRGVRADANIEDIRVGSSVIQDNDLLSIVVDADAQVNEELQVSGVFATERETENNSLYTARADYQALENLALHAGYRAIDEDFMPQLIAEETEDGDAAHDWVYDEGRQDKGVFLGVETEQQGVTLNGSYDQMYQEAILGAGTDVDGYELAVKTTLDVPSVEELATKSTEFTVAKTYAVTEGLDLAANYKAEWVPSAEEKLTHTIGAGTTLGVIPAVDGLELESEVSFTGLDNVTAYKVGADFTAPNGVNLGVEHNQDGTVMNAGIEVKF